MDRMTWSIPCCMMFSKVLNLYLANLTNFRACRVVSSTLATRLHLNSSSCLDFVSEMLGMGRVTSR
jgi:hypothetical protein